MNPKFPDDATYWTPQFASGEVKVAKSALVFVGYGVIAPEYRWKPEAEAAVVPSRLIELLPGEPWQGEPDEG